MKNQVEFLYSKFLQSDGVSIDTRTIEADNLFFGLVGEHVDGGKYAEMALAKGASFAVVQDKKCVTDPRIIYVEDCLKALQDLSVFHRERFNKKRIIFGLTGSNGKTTTKELINLVLAKKYITAATKGNYNNHIGVPLTILHIHPQVEIAIVEMGANRVGDIAELCSYANPTHGLITNIGDAHSETFGGREGIILGKSELFDHLRKTGGQVFINESDEVLANMKKRFSNPVSYPGDHVKFIAADPFIRFSLNDLEIKTKIIGTYNFENIAAAVAVGKYFGVEDEAIKEAIESYIPANWRSQFIEKGNVKIILDAYNANPTSMKLAIQNLSNFSERKVAIIGGMEEVQDSELVHLEVAEVLAQYKIDQTILIGERTKPMQEKLPQSIWYKNVENFIREIENQNFENSVVLIKASRAASLEKIEKYL